MKKTITRLALFFAIILSSYSAFSQNYVDIGLYPDTYCAPSQLSVYNYSSITLYTGTPLYYWYIDNILVSTDPNPITPFALAKGNHMVMLEVRDDYDNSLLGSKTYSIDIIGNISDYQISSGLNVCPGQNITFSLPPNIGYYNLEWDFGYTDYFTNNKSYNNPSDFSYSKVGVYTASLIVNHYCGTDTIKKTITVSNSSIPALSLADVAVESACMNDPVKFKLLNQYETYLWEFGDGTNSSLESPEHIYKTDVPTDFTAKVTVTNKCGGSSSVNFPVSLKEGVAVNADFNFNPVYGSNCVGSSIEFNPLGNGSFFWDFGDGTTSTERNPVHRFTTPYDHEVTLTVTNGCLNTNTIYKNVYIADYDESWIPYPYFTFDTPVFGAMGQSDTLFVCSGQTVKFNNQSMFELEYKYSWDFSDGTTAYGYNTSHIYTNPGVYPVILTVSNQCGSGNSSLKYVVVDDATLPKVGLKAVPTTICAGDKVYFWDDNFDPRNLYTYSINFGDGNTVSNINKIDDAMIKTLATHAYNAGGPYNYTFTATNFCGNDFSSNGTINIDNSTTRKPFYHIENSTEDESLRPPSDWSVRKSPTDFEISVNVNWPAWQASYGNTIYLNLWYGAAMPNEGYVTNPSGYVKINAADLAIGSVVKAYVPLNEGSATTVGLKAEFYCGGIARFGEESEARGNLTNGNMLFPSIPIIPSGSTDLVADGLYISIDSYWDGLCASEKPYGKWFRLVEPGVYAILEIWDTGDGIVYNMSYQDGIDMFSKSRGFDNGYFNRIGDDGNNNADSASFYSTSNTCYYDGYYQMNRLNANTLQFISYNESCPFRPVFLEGTFTKLIENPAAYSAACPGDKVQFKVVGGVSYTWNFGDGNTSTLPYPQHAYATPGTYNARVIATNSCSRKDTLYTKVTVMAKPAGHTFFYVSDNELFVGDSVHFRAEVMDPDALDNKTYSWKFGDGNSSTLKNPVHVFKKTGTYKVELTTTNGCGTGTSSQNITISEKIPDCLAKFSYWSDGATGFEDISLGNPTSWYWDFGDGTYSTEQYPPSKYYDYDGVYYVTLSIFNDLTNCFSSVTQKVVIGWSPCQADFYTMINPNSGLVNFITNSQSATNYYWDFGDGEYSIEANPSHTYSKIGAYTVCLIIWDDANGCQSVVCNEVLVVPSDGNYLLTDFDFYNNGTDNTVVFNDISTSIGSNWYWTMGDGKVLKEQNPVYTYDNPGIYKVCLTVYDNTTSLSNSICKEVRVGVPDCNVGSYFTYFINPELLEVTFLNRSKGSADEYFWSFGDGNSSTEANPLVTFNKPGYYYVTLYVRNSVDGCLDQYSEYIQVGAGNCRAGFQSRINPDNNNASFKDDSKGKIDYYYWDFGDGNYSVEQNPENLYKQTGLYLVSQTVINDLGTCMDIAADFVQVGDIDCAADFKTYIDASNSTAYFTNHAMGEYTALFWSFGDGSYSTEQNPVHEFPGSGIYSAGLNTYDFNSGCMDFYQEKLLIGNIGMDCQADFVYRVDPNTSDVTFSNKSTGDIDEFIWNFGDETDNSNEVDPVHNFAKPGYYYVCLNVKNTDGIKNIGCKWVLVQPNASNDCKADFMFSIDTTTKQVNFVDNSRGNIDKYSWDFGDSKSDSVSFLENPTHIYNQKGYYTVKLRVENTSTGCVSKEFKLLNVGDEMVLKASFGYEAFGQNKKVAGYPVDLVSASSGDGATVEWDFGDKQIKKGTFTVMDSTSLRVTHYYQLPGKYQVCLRITDPISGQSDTYCDWVNTKFGVDVEEEFLTDLNLNVYPNPFTDLTTINYSIAQPDNIEISIYDQLGRKIETLVKSRKDAGSYQIDWKTPALNPGVYHLKMVASAGTYTRQLVLTK